MELYAIKRPRCRRIYLFYTMRGCMLLFSMWCNARVCAALHLTQTDGGQMLLYEMQHLMPTCTSTYLDAGDSARLRSIISVSVRSNDGICCYTSAESRTPSPGLYLILNFVLGVWTLNRKMHSNVNKRRRPCIIGKWPEFHRAPQDCDSLWGLCVQTSWFQHKSAWTINANKHTIKLVASFSVLSQQQKRALFAFLVLFALRSSQRMGRELAFVEAINQNATFCAMKLPQRASHAAPLRLRLTSVANSAEPHARMEN